MDLSNIIHVGETPYKEEMIEYVYDVGQNIDISLAITLGLGVVKVLYDGKLFLYNADPEKNEDRLTNELLRLGMYYHIMNPEYDDRKLDYILQTKGGDFYLRTLQFVNSDDPINRLKKYLLLKRGIEITFYNLNKVCIDEILIVYEFVRYHLYESIVPIQK